MKNKIVFFLFFLLFKSNLFADNLFIQAKDITIDKNKETTIFNNEVKIKTDDNKNIQSDKAIYDRKNNFVKLEGNITATDNKKNIIKTNYAEYNDDTKVFKSVGATKVVTSENYKIEGKNVIFDNKNFIIKSEDNAIITDLENNKIFLNNFEYLSNKNIFKSIGLIELNDKMGNNYKFSQIYIDTRQKEILGTDIKAFLNDDAFKIHRDNKPRIFANTIQINDEFGKFKKGNFTLCDYREKDKCPPWTIQASQLLHDKKKKTVYYDNAIVKVYDIPIFYFPKLSHPDPTVDRRTGLLVPSFSNSKNLGSEITVPYFWDLGLDKNFTLNNKLYFDENPLFFAEYNQAFKNSNFLMDFGYTKGYKNTSNTKSAGEKSHFFSQFTKSFKGKNNSDNTLNLSVQNVSNDKYLKLYRIQSNLVNYKEDTLESGINFTHEKEDLFLGINANVYETLKSTYEDKHEYILPELTLNKNLYSDENLGNFDLVSNLKVHSYDTNKSSTFFVNDINWTSKSIFSTNFIKSKFKANLKNINYETKNIEVFKTKTTNELFGALGLLSEINFEKNLGSSRHLLTPKFLLRYAPGSMRKEENNSRLNPSRAFSFNRLDDINNFETGLSSTVGFDYKIKNNTNVFDFSVAQVINEQENKKMSSSSSLDEKMSDVVGYATLNKGKFSLNYKFALDQNYSDLNYNEFGMSTDFGPLNFDFKYLNENKHIGDQDYFKTEINLESDSKGLFSFETKRNLVTDSSEFYNLSYEYINDCLRAGLVYRREFYNDSELEPENSLMFKITLSPFGRVSSTFNQ